MECPTIDTAMGRDPAQRRTCPQETAQEGKKQVKKPEDKQLTHRFLPNEEETKATELGVTCPWRSNN